MRWSVDMDRKVFIFTRKPRYCIRPRISEAVTRSAANEFEMAPTKRMAASVNWYRLRSTFGITRALKMACFVEGQGETWPYQRHKAKVNGSTELAEVLGPTGSFGRDALRRVQRLFRILSCKQALKQTLGVRLRACFFN